MGTNWNAALPYTMNLSSATYAKDGIWWSVNVGTSISANIGTVILGAAETLTLKGGSIFSTGDTIAGGNWDTDDAIYAAQWFKLGTADVNGSPDFSVGSRFVGMTFGSGTDDVKNVANIRGAGYYAFELGTNTYIAAIDTNDKVTKIYTNDGKDDYYGNAEGEVISVDSTSHIGTIGSTEYTFTFDTAAGFKAMES